MSSPEGGHVTHAPEHADPDQREGHPLHGDPHHGHAHAHGEEHAHAHSTAGPPPAGAPRGEFTGKEARQARGLATVLAIVTAFFGFELAGAGVARSVVLEADALHLLMDVLALAVSLIAMRVGLRRPAPRFTFGMRRAEPVAGIFNAV